MLSTYKIISIAFQILLQLISLSWIDEGSIVLLASYLYCYQFQGNSGLKSSGYEAASPVAGARNIFSYISQEYSEERTSG